MYSFDKEDMEMRTLLTVRQVAQRFNCRPRKIYYLKNLGLPFLRIGGSIRFDPKAVEEYERAHTEIAEGGADREGAS